MTLAEEVEAFRRFLNDLAARAVDASLHEGERSAAVTSVQIWTPALKNLEEHAAEFEREQTARIAAIGEAQEARVAAANLEKRLAALDAELAAEQDARRTQTEYMRGALAELEARNAHALAERDAAIAEQQNLVLIVQQLRAEVQERDTELATLHRKLQLIHAGIAGDA